jgi:hypothetical protein
MQTMFQAPLSFIIKLGTPTNSASWSSGLFFILLLGYFALLPAQGQLSPLPDGCYPNFTTAEGCNALDSLTTGTGNTAIGWRSLSVNSSGSFNTGVGGGALALNNADSNTAVGAAALLLNSSGVENTAVGTDAMVFNDVGHNNAAFGAFALYSNTEGILNTADGFRAMYLNTIGSTNTAAGVGALSSNTEGNDNTAVGVNALLFNTSGNNNTAVGRSAGLDIHGSGNVCIGQGVSGEDGVDDSTYIRNVNATEQAPDEGIAFVTVRLSDSRLGHQPIAMRGASPELQKTVDDLKSRVARQEAMIIQQQKAMEMLTAQLKEQAEQMQKVSAQTDANGRSAPMIVNNQ